MRAADGANKKCAFRPAVGTKLFGGIDLGATVKTFDRGADGRACRRRDAVCDSPAGIHHGVDDLGIARTAAQHPTERVLDGVPVRGVGLAQQRGGRHHHARRADAALRCPVPQERGLQRRQRFVLSGQRFRCFHPPPFKLSGRDQTGADRVAVKKHRTGTAVAGVAAHLGGAEGQRLAQHLTQTCGRGACHLPNLAIDGEADAPVGGLDSVHHAVSSHNLPTSLVTSSAAASRR